jgi:hypothetical protein
LVVSARERGEILTAIFILLAGVSVAGDETPVNRYTQ